MKRLFLGLCAAGITGVATAKEPMALEEGHNYLDTHFVTGSVGYLSEFDVPYYALKIGGEVGPDGNIFFQVLGFSGEDHIGFGNDDYDFLTYGIGYQHYFPVFPNAAITLSSSIGGVYGNIDWSYQGQKIDSLQGNAMYIDSNIGLDYCITDRLILNISGKIMWMADFSDGAFTYNGVPYEWQYKHEDIYVGAELGLTYLF